MFRSARSLLVCLGVLLTVLTAGAAYRFYVTRPVALLQRGRTALARGQWHLVERSLEQLEKQGAQDAAHLLRGERELSQARLTPEPAFGGGASGAIGPSAYERALAEFAQVRTEGALADTAAVLGAECLVHLGQRPFAAEVLDKVVQRQPDQKEAHRWLAAIYIDLNSPKQAITHLRAWARLEPRNGRPYRWIGLFLVKDYAQFKEAVAAYREALRRDLDADLRADVVKELAEALIDGPADFAAALEVLDQAERTPETPELLTLRAQCLWNLARPTEAAVALDAACRTRPELPQALRLRANMLLTQGQADAALPFLEQLLRIDAHDHVSRQLVMQVYQQRGDRAHAEQERQRLEETRRFKDQLTKLHEEALRRPWDSQVRQQLAELCEKLQRPAEAHMWRQAASACLSNPSSEATLEPTFSLPGRN